LAANTAVGYAGPAWGYSFPWQSRRLWLDRAAPSGVCTAFVARAFLDAHTAWGESRDLDVAAGAARFLVQDCPRQDGCISYVPGVPVFVHNASILAAAVIADVWRRTGGESTRLRSVADQAAAFTIADQRLDGGWAYDPASARADSFIDGFHTGLVIEGLDDIAQALDADYSDSIGNGLDFYRGQLIDADGQPRRQFGRDRPTDIRDAAQALRVLARFRDRPGALAQRSDVLSWTLAHMYDRRGYFVYEHGSGSARLNRGAFPRWQAWMLLALLDDGSIPAGCAVRSGELA
jgi:hypothetical protein